MVIQRVSVQDFEQFVELPENSERLFELVNGEIVEKMPSNIYVSFIAIRISHFIMTYLEAQGKEGIVSGESGGYQIGDERYAPDVAYLSSERQEKASRKGYNPLAPDLAVEVESNTTGESERRLRGKIFNYLDAGTMVWVIYAETKEVEVYAPDEPVQILTLEDVLSGGQVLPGFNVAVKEIFPK